MKRSLYLRLLIYTACGSVMALSVLGLVLSDLFSSYAVNEFYDDLEVFQADIALVLGNELDSRDFSPRIFGRQFMSEKSGYYWQIEDGHGTVWRSPSLGAASLTLPPHNEEGHGLKHFRLTGPDGAALLAVEGDTISRVNPWPLHVMVAGDTSQIEESRHNFHQVLILSLSILGLGLIVASSFQIWMGLRPLLGLRAQLALVASGKRKTIDCNLPVEVAPLVDEMNKLLTYQAEVVERGRVLAGNLAHSLKTPLAIIGNAVDGNSPHIIKAQITQMQRLVDYHTARARAAVTRNVLGQSCPLQATLHSLTRVIERLYADKDLAIALDLHPDAAFRGDVQDLEEILGNLLDNAAKWTHRRIHIQSRPLDCGRMTVTIDDDGPGLKDKTVEDLFSRGYRGDTDMPGTGLGLAIVRDIVELYEGSITLAPSDLGGLRVMLILPCLA